MSALETKGLCKQFGALQVTKAVDLTLGKGARHALIGPNGAGKSTLINLLTGVMTPSAGSIFLHGERIDRMAAEERVTRGLGRTFQVNALFPRLTALEAVTLAMTPRHGYLGRPFFPLRRCSAAIDEAYELLQGLGFGDTCLVPTSSLPYGRQRLLEIALALASKPKVILLDEPAAGVPAGEALQLMEAIERLPADVAVLFIEHDMDLVFRFAEKISVLVAGAILCEGTPQEIAANPDVRRVYLGASADG